MREICVRRARLLPAAAVFLFSASSQAQEGEVSRQGAPAMETTVGGEVAYTFRPSVSLDGDGGELSLTTVQATASVRIPFGTRTFLTPGISYQGQDFDYDGMSAPGARELHSLEAPFTLVHMLNQKWSLMGRVSPGLSGDFKTLDRHFSISGGGAAIYQLQPGLSLGFGAALSYATGRWLPVPVATVNWQASERVRVDALLPQFARATYRVGHRWELGAMVQGEGARWGLDAETGEERSIDYFSIDAGAVAGVRLMERTWLGLFAGWNLLRDYDVHGGAMDGDYNPGRGFVIRAGLEMRLPGS
jgi:Domain of unknown function (DUF6268)